jgi:hypothetical protein
VMIGRTGIFVAVDALDHHRRPGRQPGRCFYGRVAVAWVSASNFPFAVNGGIKGRG